MATRYRKVRALALRLLRGEVIERVDEHGRRWKGTATVLAIMLPETGETALIIEGDAYDVAERLSTVG